MNDIICHCPLCCIINTTLTYKSSTYLRTYKLNNYIIMSDKTKKKRAEREAKQEKQAQIIIRCICVALVVLAVAFLIYSTSLA